jgi:hypothetical protein
MMAKPRAVKDAEFASVSGGAGAREDVRGPPASFTRDALLEAYRSKHKVRWTISMHRTGRKFTDDTQTTGTERVQEEA